MRKRKKLIRFFGVVLCVLVVAAGALVYATYDNIQAILANPGDVFDSTTEDLSIVVTPTPGTDGADKKLKYNNNLINIAVIGVDSDAERAENNSGYCADTLMLLSIDKSDNSVSIISIPRDTQASINKMDKNGKVTGSYTGKINSAYGAAASASKENRFKNVMSSMSDVLEYEGVKIPISYYIGMDMDGFDDIVDAIGGVDVTLEMDVDRIGEAGETVHLEGTDAQHFVRVRKTLPQGDFSRARNQQIFITAVAQKVKKMGAVETAMRLYGQFVTYVTTDMTKDEIIGLAGILVNVDLENLEHVVLTGKSDSKELVHIDEDLLYETLVNCFFIES